MELIIIGTIAFILGIVAINYITKQKHQAQS
jgi:hypothetical protein